MNASWSSLDWRAWGIATHTHYVEVDSTQTAAHALAAGLADTELPLLVTCERQTAGRGRGNRHWLQQTGGLAFTVVLPIQPVGLAETVRGDWPRWWALWTGLALQATTASHLPGVACRLKWPNDLWIDGRKNAGILLETLRGRPETLVVGIGVNVNNRMREAPPGQTAVPISWSELGADVELPVVLGDFLQRWLPVPERPLLDLAACCERFARVDALVGSRLVVTSANAFRAGSDDPTRLEPAPLTAEDRPAEGAALVFYGAYQGIGHDGCLRLRTDDGRDLIFPTAEQVRVE